MRKLALSVLPALFIAALVSAQSKKADGWHVGSPDTAVKLGGPVYIDARSNNGSIGGCDGGAGICFSGKGVLVHDMLSVPTAGGNGGCIDSTVAGTATGCAFGDTVLLGIDQVPANIGTQVTAYISAADSFKIRVCNHNVDGGAADMPDASYTVRCFR